MSVPETVDVWACSSCGNALESAPRPCWNCGGKDRVCTTIPNRHPTDASYYTAGKKVAVDWPAEDPAPVALSTDPRPADAPEERRAMVNVVNHARKNGWEVRVGYSRGLARAVRKGTYKTVHTFGLWGKGYGWRWAAMYAWSPDLAQDWGWASTAIWREDGEPVAAGESTRFTHCNVTDLRAFLGLNGGVGPAWFKAVHARVVEQAEKQKAKGTTKKAKEGAS